jgi:membrane protein
LGIVLTAIRANRIPHSVQTYYLLLAAFPALAALVSVYGLVANPAGAAKSVQSLSGMLPQSTVELINGELRQLVSASSKSLSLGAVIWHHDRSL